MRVCYFNSTQAAVSPPEEEGLPSCKHARLSWPRGKPSIPRCRCACSHALVAARTLFPPHSAALITPGALEPATAAAPAASVAAMATAGSHATVRLPAPPYRCPRRPFWAAVVVGIARSRWYRTHMPPAAAFQAQSSSRRLRTCIPHAHRNEHTACWLRSPHRSAGRGRSELESRVSPSGRAVTVRMRKF